MKKLVIVILLCLIATAVFGQTRPTLAILPFTGGRSGEGETLAELFSFDQTLNGAFTPIPRTSINAAIQKEQNFQMASGMTDPETIARLGKQLGARFIVAGSITRLGSQQLVVIAIMQIENLQQIAGEWLTYQNISEVRGKLPEMAKNIVAASQRNTSRLQKLAILPFQTASDDREGDALAQILAIEIIRTGNYAVFPRTKTLEQVQTEYKTQTSGITDDYSIAAIGRGDNPLLALSGAARRLGQDRMFNAAIINVESGAQEKGETVDYQVIEDGPEAMKKLVNTLATVNVFIGKWKAKNKGVVLEFNRDGTFTGTGYYSKVGTSYWATWSSSSSRSRLLSYSSGGGHYVEEYTLIRGSISGTYTFTLDTLTLTYKISGSRETKSLVEVNIGYDEKVSANPNYTGQGTCVVTFSVSEDRRTFKIGQHPFFIESGMTGYGQNGTDYYSEFVKE